MTTAAELSRAPLVVIFLSFQAAADCPCRQRSLLEAMLHGPKIGFKVHVILAFMLPGYKPHLDLDVWSF